MMATGSARSASWSRLQVLTAPRGRSMRLPIDRETPMRRLLIATTTACLAASGTAGTGTAAPASSSVTASVGATTVSPFPFADPESAMRYLAAAYNRNDAATVRSVTTPSARVALAEHGKVMTNLQLRRCERRKEIGDYLCSFTYAYPASLHKKSYQHGIAVFVAGPATKQGWYMTVLESCGEA